MLTRNSRALPFFLFLVTILSALFLVTSCSNNTDLPDGDTDEKNTAAERETRNFEEILDYYQSIDYDELMSQIEKATPEDLPKIKIEGRMTGITKETEKKVKISYSSKDLEFECYAYIDVQGASSAGMAKRNYNIKLYTDESMTEKYKVKFDPAWGSESKYCLKANYIDATMARNIVSARLWAQMVDTREHVVPDLQKLVNRGATDGFPVMVQINDEEETLYTLNIPRDKWMFKMGNSDTEAIFMASYTTNSTAFGKLINLRDDRNGWTVEYAAGGSAGWAADSLNRAIQVTIDSGEQFKENIAKHIDIEAAIDYLLFLYFTTGQDNLTKNTLWVTFDGNMWYPSVYDLDATWGLLWNGQSLMSPEEVVPKKEEDGSFSSRTYSRLWEHIFITFTDEIIERYTQLRATVFTPENVEYEFTRFMAQIPDEIFEHEFKISSIPSERITNLNQIIRHHKNVLRYTDTMFNMMSQQYFGTELTKYYEE